MNQENFRLERFQVLQLLVFTFVETRNKKLGMSDLETWEDEFGISLGAAEKMETLFEIDRFLSETNFWLDFGGKKRNAAISSFFNEFYSGMNKDREFQKSKIILYLIFLQMLKAETYSGMFEGYEKFTIIINRHLNELVSRFDLTIDEVNSIREEARIDYRV